MTDRRAVAHAGERKRFTAKGERTRTAILDAAERQFSERGYDGVSLRQIMEEASVQMGQLQYYFPSKEAVFVETIERRLPEVMRDYSEAMANLVRRGNLDGLDLREVVRAVMATSRAWLSSNDSGRHRYLKMLGLSTISFSQADYISRHTAAFKPLNDIAVGYIAKLYPDAAADRVLAAYYLLESSLLSLYVNIDSIFARSGRRRTGAAVRAFYDDLENFAVGGMERLLTAP
jgi:AcrR family transcriptional regulator